ncbi:MAG: transglycosylase domain-containing protein [Candidatus Komeilibacteria bacterium]|nr:transglycosylase domain-containing protein [Candidatus Komeilibacteria bacterium]
MPIPHLNHKIHSPKDKNDRPSKVIGLNHQKKRFLDIRFNPKNEKFSLLGLFKKYWRHGLAAFLFVLVFSIVGVAWLSKDLPDPGKLIDRAVAQSTKIYDRTGEHLLYDIHGDQQRTLIKFENIPAHAVNATLALEDQRFYEHGGFSLWGMFRGVVIQTLKGKRPQGGSTLTQQLVKNAILSNKRSPVRKIKELILAYRIERKFSKQEILQMYFNEIPYGGSSYGIEAAAFSYFGKSAKELTVGEAAVLAALPQAPSYYSPYGSHVDELLGRQKYALDQMVRLGYLTAEQGIAAKEEKIEFKARIEGIEAPHFVFFVKELLAEKYGDALIEQGGWRIISTLDYDLQKEAEKILAEQAEKNLANFDAANASLIAIDVKTGQILAMVGSKDFFNVEIDGQFNSATSPRQPGSSFKPIVYTAAWQRGYVPETVVYDLFTSFPTPQGPYEPRNYDLKERGPVNLRQALAGSLNIPAVKMIYLAGIANVLDLADDLEYTTLKDRSRFGLSLVLGGGEVTLLEHTNAYATLARDGKKIPYTAVLKLEDHEQKVLEEFREPRTQKVLEPDIARLTTDVLSDNNARAYVFGASNYLTLGDRPVAAKTGTTNDYHDAWTLGYTPQIAVGVWVGNNNNDEMKRGADGSQIAAPIWQKVMRAAHAKLPVENFVKPIYKIPAKPMMGGSSAGVTVKIDKMTGLLATEATPVELVEEKTFRQAHEILHYVDKDDPLGGIPTNPAKDEQYNAWEAPVARWAEKNNITNELPPTEFDNVHRGQDKPTIELTSPSANAVINQETFNVSVRASANRGVNKVEYYLDNEKLGTAYQSPFDLTLTVPAFMTNGAHRLRAKASDDLQNSAEASIEIKLDREASLSIDWLEPLNQSVIKRADFPLALKITINEPAKITKVDFYYQKSDDNESHWLGYTESGQDNNLTVVWRDLPPAGTYRLFPVITDLQSQAIKGPEITITLE